MNTVYYRPQYVAIHEIVTPELYKQYINNLDTLWRLFDARLLWTLDQLRIIFGPIIINTWYIKKNNTYTINSSGFRERGIRNFSSTVGASLSQHKFGRAIDCHFNTISSQEIIKKIENLGMFKDGNWRTRTDDPLFNAFKYITCIERTLNGNPVNWLHIDTGNRPSKNNEIIALNI